MSTRRHQNGEITLDKESADKLLTFITRFNQALDISEVSRPTPQGGQLHDNGCASRQDGPEENDERQKQERKVTLTRETPGYSEPPPSLHNSTGTQTLSTGVQVNLSTHSTPRNSACVIDSGHFTPRDLHRTSSQLSSGSDRSCTQPGVQPSSARGSSDSGIIEELPRRRAATSGRTKTRQTAPHPLADKRRPESPGTRQVSVTDGIVRSASPATFESFIKVVPETNHSNDLPLAEAAVPTPNPSEVIPAQGGNIGTREARPAVRRRDTGQLPTAQSKDINQPERNGNPEIQQKDSGSKDRQALMKISDRITTNTRGLKKKQTYTAEEVRGILEGIMEDIPILRNSSHQGRPRPPPRARREAMDLEDNQSDFSVDQNATKQTTKRRSDKASAACGEEGRERVETTARNKRQRARRQDDDESFA